MDATLIQRSNPERQPLSGAEEPYTTASFSSIKIATGSGLFRPSDDRLPIGSTSKPQTILNIDPTPAAILQSSNRL